MERKIDGKEQGQPSRIVTMATTNIHMVAIDSLLLISHVFCLILRCDRTGQKMLALYMSCKTASLQFEGGKKFPGH